MAENNTTPGSVQTGSQPLNTNPPIDSQANPAGATQTNNTYPTSVDTTPVVAQPAPATGNTTLDPTMIPTAEQSTVNPTVPTHENTQVQDLGNGVQVTTVENQPTPEVNTPPVAQANSAETLPPLPNVATGNTAMEESTSAEVQQANPPMNAATTSPEMNMMEATNSESNNMSFSQPATAPVASLEDSATSLPESNTQQILKSPTSETQMDSPVAPNLDNQSVQNTPENNMVGGVSSAAVAPQPQAVDSSVNSIMGNNNMTPGVKEITPEPQGPQSSGIPTGMTVGKDALAQDPDPVVKEELPKLVDGKNDNPLGQTQMASANTGMPSQSSSAGASTLDAPRKMNGMSNTMQAVNQDPDLTGMGSMETPGEDSEDAKKKSFVENLLEKIKEMMS